MRTLALALTSLVVMGCFHRGPPAPSPARGPARDSLLQLDRSRGDSLVANGPVDGMLALMGRDVIYLRAGVPTVYGRAATRALIAAAPKETPPGTVWQPLGGGVSYDLRSAYTFGIVARTVSRAEATEPSIRLERYIAFWQRAPRQPWRIEAYAEVNGPSEPEVPLPSEATVPPRLPRNAPLDAGAASLRAADSSFADLSDRMGVAFAFSNTVAPYGVVFGTSRLAVGPDAVGQVLEVRQAGSSLTWRPVYAAVSGSIDLGFTIGESISTGRGASGAAVQRFGKYLTVWEKQRDGTWKFDVDGGNTSR